MIHNILLDIIQTSPKSKQTNKPFNILDPSAVSWGWARNISWLNPKFTSWSLVTRRLCALAIAAEKSGPISGKIGMSDSCAYRV